MKLTFSAAGLPPKKDGATSMWRKDAEVDRLIALRLAAAGALGDRTALEATIRLTLVVHISTNDRTVGDLDNFVCGVLDGLQTAHPNTPWHKDPRWSRPEIEHVRPSTWSMIVDDVEVVEICARKVVGEVAAGQEWYEVELEASE